ncbi:ABC transporter substrate-binding protein [Algoriphagus machipongonensis]|uniref:ABC-type Fe3+-siderophore transporter n=1 Tax=Algoriphagus machipongonensis TaxID=388413 RepID=A3I2F0_9BACT|nr:helical backbone metal receptor [Algoriphagus machipongonensis]EAZ79554.1 ABC-type Fe3+-siderophore transporter [Algoriphagus machipongonensis]
MKITDQLRRTLTITTAPKRIVSLVPSQTELLVYLGLEDRIVGVTKFCIYPSSIRKSKTIVGGTKNYRFDVIESLKPDLIIGNKEENEEEGVKQLMQKYPVWMSDIVTIGDSLEMIRSLGKLLDVEEKSEEMISQLQSDFLQTPKMRKKAIYLIWNDPVMLAGKGTFINEMMPYAGFENVSEKERYPISSLDEIQEINPEYILLSSEPFPFKEKHVENFKRRFPQSKVLLVDGTYFSWYGSRLMKSKAYFQTLFI